MTPRRSGLLPASAGGCGGAGVGIYRRCGRTVQPLLFPPAHAKGEIVATRATNEVLLHLLKIALYAGLAC
jgi:hypothetical protein